ncbi:hypothetical protein [Glycomyces tarimensis]
MARRALAALVLALGAAVALTACGEDELPTDVPSVPDFEESLEELAPELPTDFPSDIAEIAPDIDPTEVLRNADEICRKIEEGQEAEELARDAAELFGVEESEGARLVDAIEPNCDAV